VIGETNPEVYNRTMSWYEGGPRQRLQPGGAIIVVMTRWSLRDLTGQLLKKQQADELSDQWEVVQLPAILPSGNPIWPEYWAKTELLRTKASIPISKWNAQYQQNPTSEEGALIKRDYWRDWDRPKPPKCDVVIQSWDTAFTNTTRADYSACTTWGVFVDEEDEDRNKLILLDAIRGKWEFPELKKRAKQHYTEWEPDICLIEARGAGQPLIYELRQMNIPISEVVVGRGGTGNPNDKISRVNAITDIFASGMVYARKMKSWAQEVIEECAAFPAGDHDDYVDTVTMAMQRFRMGGWIGTANDDDEDFRATSLRKMEYY
jgi:predicted phage terminase large subunit-like protein